MQVVFIRIGATIKKKMDFHIFVASSWTKSRIYRSQDLEWVDCYLSIFYILAPNQFFKAFQNFKSRPRNDDFLIYHPNEMLIKSKRFFAKV